MSLVLRGEVRNGDTHQRVLKIQIWGMGDGGGEAEPHLRMNKPPTPVILKLGRGEREICHRD